MKLWKLMVLPLIIAVMVAALPVSLAEGLVSAPAQGYRAVEDYTKVHWFAECGDQRLDITGAAGQNTVLAVDATPKTSWNIGAEFVRVRDGRLVPFEGELDVTRHCDWATDGLTWDGGAVSLPEVEGVYTLTGQFTDDEGNFYVCEIRFDVSEDHVPPKPRLKSRAGATTVAQKVNQLVQQCQAEGFTTDYDKAVWFHDWLIYNANYDYSYLNYDADGVLLKGTGVCDSYSKAFKLLLDAVGIENDRVISEEMNHAWNIAKLDGTWCHIDCTWDDPGTGGNENHDYFGMSAKLIGRDHTWSHSYPSATSLDNYYPIRDGARPFSTDEELNAVMAELAGDEVSPITVVYIGEDADVTAYSALQTWINKNYWKYGMTNYAFYGSGKAVMSLKTEYTDPWEQPDNHLTDPVDAPDFSLESPNGTYQLKNYGNNGVLLIFGRTTCGNTRNLLNKLLDRVQGFYSNGVEVLVSMVDASEPSDLTGIEGDYPGYHYTYNSDLLWNYLRAVDFPTQNGVIFPCVFVINSSGKITYYSTGYVNDPSDLINEVNAVTTGKALPEPQKHQDISDLVNGTGNINDISGGESILSAVKSEAEQRNVILLVGYLSTSQLDYYEKNYSVLNKLGVTLIAGLQTEVTDDMKAAYPHCRFVDYSNKDFWALQYATGYESGTSISGLADFLILRGGEIAAYTKGDYMSLSKCALYIARNLKYEAAVPRDLTELEAEAFANTGFESIDLTNGHLTAIRSGAFSGCGELAFIRIPESVTTIEDGAFAGAENAVIVCTVGTAGYRYAVNNGFDYICE